MPYASDTYPTPNRIYSGNYGRWLSPDPLGGDITDPQSLNRYAYVMNNPTNFVDPLGLAPCQQGTPFCHAGNDVVLPYGCIPGREASCAYVSPIQQEEEAAYVAQVTQAFLDSTPPGGTVILPDGTIRQWQSDGYGMAPAPQGSGFDFTMFEMGQWVTIGTTSNGWDFTQFVFSAGSLVGGSLAITKDRYGHWYVGLGPQAGKTPQAVSGSLTIGMMKGHDWYAPSPGELQNFLTGWGCSAGGGSLLGYFFGWSSGGQAHEVGFASPQVGVGCTYSWRIR